MCATKASSIAHLSETLGAIIALAQDGDLYREGFGCGSKAECFVAVNSPKQAITLRHTVWFDELDPHYTLVRHEMQHVTDIEQLGGIGFYLGYAYNFARPWAAGDPDPYRNSPFEQRATAAENRGPGGRALTWYGVWGQLLSSFIPVFL